MSKCRNGWWNLNAVRLCVPRFKQIGAQIHAQLNVFFDLRQKLRNNRIQYILNLRTRLPCRDNHSRLSSLWSFREDGTGKDGCSWWRFWEHLRLSWSRNLHSRKNDPERCRSKTRIVRCKSPGQSAETYASHTGKYLKLNYEICKACMPLFKSPDILPRMLLESIAWETPKIEPQNRFADRGGRQVALAVYNT